MSPSEGDDRVTEPEPDHREDVYVAFTMNEVVKTVLHDYKIGIDKQGVQHRMSVNLDFDYNGELVGIELPRAIYVEVDGLRINK